MSRAASAPLSFLQVSERQTAAHQDMSKVIMFARVRTSPRSYHRFGWGQPSKKQLKEIAKMGEAFVSQAKLL